MGIGDHGILAVGKGINEIAEATVDTMMDEDAEIISLYYGEGVTEEQAEELCQILQEKYPDCDVEVNFGGQPIYYYFLSVE